MPQALHIQAMAAVYVKAAPAQNHFMKLNFARLLLFAISLGFLRMNAEAEENKDEWRMTFI
jgi:hypothetical protein